jgi:hypothetical protein
MAGRRPARPGRRWPAIHRRPSMRVFRFRNTGRPSGLRVAGCRGRPAGGVFRFRNTHFPRCVGVRYPRGQGVTQNATPPPAGGGDAKCYTPPGRGGSFRLLRRPAPAAKSTLASSPCAPCQILRLLDRKTFHA